MIRGLAERLLSTIDERYDYIAVIRVKDDPSRAHKVRFELVEGTDSVDTARFC